MPLRYWAVIVILGISWGMSFLFNAILLRDLGPLTVTFGRVCLGGLGCWAYVFLRGYNWRLPAPLVAKLFAFGVLSYTAPFICYAVAQQHIASGVAGIVNATTPAFAVVVAHFWPGGERATWPKSLGVLAGVIGIILLSLPILRQGDATKIWAVMIMLGAPMAYAVSVNLVGRFRAVPPAVLLSWGLTGASAVVGVLALVLEGVPHALSWQGVGALACIGLLLTTTAFLVFYWLLPKVGPTNMTLVTLIAPASALVLGVSLLGEPLLPTHLLGLVAILLGLLLIDGRILRWKKEQA